MQSIVNFAKSTSFLEKSMLVIVVFTYLVLIYDCRQRSYKQNERHVELLIQNNQEQVQIYRLSPKYRRWL